MLAAAKVILVGCMVISVIWLLVRLAGGLKPGKTLWTGMLMGLFALLFVSLIGVITSDTLQINPFTLGVSAVLGVPGVVLMLIVKIIWKL